MDLQFWIGFWLLCGCGIPSAVSCFAHADGDRRTREHAMIERGPSLCLENKENLKNLPAYARHRKGKVPILSLEEVWAWCEQNLDHRPYFLKDKLGTPYAVFKNDNDAFHFKMRWL
jgi:hypothetical protein